MIDEAVGGYTTEAVDEIGEVMDDEKGKVGHFVKDLMNKIYGDKQETDQFVQASQSGLSKTDAEVNNLKTILDDTIAQSQAKQNSLMGKIASYSTQQAALRASAEQQVQAQTDDLGQRTKELEQSLDARVKQMEALQEDNMRQSQGQLDKAFKDEEAREQVQNQ